MLKPERSPGSRSEFFERHSWCPTVLLVLLPFVLQVPLWLLKRSNDPIWFCSGLKLGPIPAGLPFLDPNVGFTSEALGRLAAGDWLHGIVPWWNPYTGIGMPLAGELQPGAFFLPFNLLLLLSQGILWQQISMQIIAGLATYALLRELGLTRLAAWMGGALFALNGTIAWAPGPAAVYCTLPFLPLLLFGIERARKQQQGPASILIIGIATCGTILAGFPEPAYISALPVLAWGLYRMTSRQERGKMAGRAIAGVVLGLLVAAPLLIAFVDYMRQSDSWGVHNLGEKSLPAAAFSMTLMPYVYGLLGTIVHSIPLSQIWANIGGYTGVLVVVLAIVGLTSKSAHRGLKVLLLAWILVAFAKTFGVRPVMALMNPIPLMRQTAFFRYAPPSWELALIILAAFGLDDFLTHAPAKRRPFLIVMGLLAIAVALAWPQRAFWERPRAFVPISFLLLGLSITWAFGELLAAGLLWKLLHAERRRAGLACLLVFDAAVMFMVPQASSIRGNYIDLPAIQFLRDHQDLSRIYTLGPLQPNYGAYFQVASINHNVEPVPKLWADYVERNLLPGFSRIDSAETFWSGAMPEGEGEKDLSQYLANYQDLGVRYVITKAGRSPLPTTFLPPADTGNQPASGGRSITSRWNVVSAALERCHSIADDPAKPAVERLVAKMVLKIGHSVAGDSMLGVRKNGESTEHGSAESVTLQSDQGARTSVLAPPPLSADSSITSVGTIINNPGLPADGNLAVEICAATVCRSGSKLLAGSPDNTVFQIPLDSPLAAAAGAPLRLTFAHQNGSRPVSLRIVSVVSGRAQQLQGPDGVLPDRTLQLAFEYGTALSRSRKLYTDSLLDIWELPNPAPYFQVIQGGPCTLSTMRRADVTAECTAPATLVRRELYMPGWRVAVNGKAPAAVEQEGIFQSDALPAGHNQVRYYFTPPAVEFGWAAAAAGMAGLIGQFILLVGRSKRQRL
jgi:hypothetical protein